MADEWAFVVCFALGAITVALLFIAMQGSYVVAPQAGYVPTPQSLRSR